MVYYYLNLIARPSLFSEREREREEEREVKNVKSFLLKELSELIFCLTFVKDAFILSAGNR